MAEQGDAAARPTPRPGPGPKRQSKARPAARTGKAIVLFSDGTGNSSGKLFKTNVWRMYEAVDLGPDTSGAGTTQIAYYDDGVGTSAFKLFALLGGILGYGLKRNILDIYRYLCRNYEPGDRIYAFGFSRGAFTIRNVVGLIGSQGIVPYNDERDLRRQAADAYRAFRRPNRPNIFPWAASVARAIRDLLLWIVRRAGRAPAFRPGKPGVPVAFIGVWDTVAAYGGPIAEITRAVDNWVWPLTMTDQQLGDHVEVARHALALDDERDSFQPVLWDEVREDRVADAAEREELAAPKGPERDAHRRRKEHYRTRLRQVWFAGMHADVGGGYPDESLSFVSLLWMMREAGAAGLRLLPDTVNRVQQLSTPLGPIHDSRQGLASYYRYQPRKIAAFLHPRGTGTKRLYCETLSLRDPTIGEREYRPQGLLMTCRVHESVIARIDNGTDGYAPIGLPETFDVTPPPAEPPLPGAVKRPPLVDAVKLARLADPATAAGRSERQETIWDVVLKRRLTYFATVALSLVLAASPLWVDAVPPIPPSTDGRWVLATPISWIGYLLPAFAEPWTEAAAAAPFYFLVLLVIIWLTMRTSAAFEAQIRDRTCRLWHEVLDGRTMTGPVTSRTRRFRNSYAYQRGLQLLKWQVAPNLIGPLMVAAIIYLGAVIWGQASLSRDERIDRFCKSSAGPIVDVGASGVTRPFSAALACNPTAVQIRKDHRYRITFKTPGPWSDGTKETDPRGFGTAQFPARTAAVAWLAAPFRRVVSANWMEALYEIRPPRTGGEFPRVFIDKLGLEAKGKLFVGEFQAPMDGELMLFVNEAVLPGYPETYFYGPNPDVANAGLAEVTIEDLDASVDEDKTGPASAGGRG